MVILVLLVVLLVLAMLLVTRLHQPAEADSVLNIKAENGGAARCIPVAIRMELR